jgi:hypothetical protein
LPDASPEPILCAKLAGYLPFRVAAGDDWFVPAADAPLRWGQPLRVRPIKDLAYPLGCSHSALRVERSRALCSSCDDACAP